MTNFTSYPREDFFRTTLSASINSTATSIGISKAPAFTLSSGTCYGVIDPDGTAEIVEISAISSTTLTVTRGVAKFEGGSSTAAAHAGGVEFLFTNNWKTFDDIQTAIASKADTDEPAFTTSMTVPVYADDAARDAGIPSPVNGMECYNTADGEFQDYTAGAWVSRATGSTPNASETVAGKVELATAAERAAGTGTGGTGAELVVTNDALVKTSSGAGDENKLAVLNASGQFDTGFVNLGAAIQSSLLTAKGSMVGASAASTPAERTVGTDDQVLTADSTDGTGIAWKTVKVATAGEDESGTISATGNVDITCTTGYTPGVIELFFGGFDIPGDTNNLDVLGDFVFDGTTFKYRRVMALLDSVSDTVNRAIPGYFQIETTNSLFQSVGSGGTPDDWHLTISVQNVTSTGFDVRFAATKFNSPADITSIKFGWIAHPA